MFTFVIPQLASIVEGSGQAIPIYTQVLFKVSDFMNAYWAWLLILSLTGAAGIWYWARSEEGIVYIDNLKLEIPVIGKLYRQLYPARIADNLSTLLSSGVSLVRSIEITASVVDHALYKEILMNVLEDVKGGKSLSKSIDGNKAFPSIFVQMVKVGEETGELGDVLKTVSKFYEREVYGSINTIVDLIVPMMIAFLGLAVGLLLVMVLMPIYNISSGSGF